MKRGKSYLPVAVLVSVLAFTGCANVPELDEKQEALIAEYSAGVLLRYSEQYDKRLVTKEENGVEATATPTAMPVTSPTGTSAPQSVNEPAVTAAAEETAEPVTETSLNELYRMKGIQVSYDSFRFTQKYGSSQIRADKGQTLLVVTFSLKNVSGATKKVNLMDGREITYTLDVDGSQYAPGINILSNGGMDHLDTTIAKGKKEKAVLIFQMDDARRQASSMSLTIKEHDRQTNLKLK